MNNNAKTTIENGTAILGIEFGSTRIKAVLIDKTHTPIATGNHIWENQLLNNIWTYSLDDIWNGLQNCYRSLTEDIKRKYGLELRHISALGFSGMMHGYMPFNAEESLLVPFRTWRNTITLSASKELTKKFNFNIPQRWSIAHLYQAILNEEDHVKDISFITTLAGYIHWKLSGEKVLGIGEASGMFPINSATCSYNETMLSQFDKLIEDKKYNWKLIDILPTILCAGEHAGNLTPEGAKLLDPTGTLKAGVPMCPPEGDASTGMVATNSVTVQTANVSAGTSIFAMVVTDTMLSKVHNEIDMVTTPDGVPVAMTHCNNCTSDLNFWINLFKQFADIFHMNLDTNKMYTTLYNLALMGDKDCSGLLSYNYISGEHITGFEEGIPLFMRTPNAKFTLPNFIRTHLYSALATLRIGLDILLKEENIVIESINAHGGLFKTPIVGQSILAAAVNTPVTVLNTANEGGAWGIAILAAYMVEKTINDNLSTYLDKKIFASQTRTTITPDVEDVAGFNTFITKYKNCLSSEREALINLRGE